MRIVDCVGQPRARGRAHGETLRPVIAAALDRWAVATLGATEDIDAYCVRFLGQTGLLQHLEAETPDLHAEMAGIAEGAGQPFARIAAYNLMDEQWWFDARAAAPPPGCSLIAQPVPGGHALAQNMDLPGHMDGAQVALRLSGPDMPDTVVLSAAGLIGLTGANAAGLAIGVNTLLMLNHDGGGLPVAFALRHALGACDLDSARQRLAGAAHASGQHYALATRDRVLSLECSAGGCAVGPVDPSGRLLHTNHPLASDDIDNGAQARLDRAGFNRSSHQRLDWLRSTCAERAGAEDIRALFDDQNAPICMHPDRNAGSGTFASVLFTLTDQPRIAMRAGGAGGGGTWHDISFAATTITEART